MHFDVPKVVRSPGCDHGHDEESRNGRDIKIDILDDYIWITEWFRVKSAFYRSTGGVTGTPRGLMGHMGPKWRRGGAARGWPRAPSPLVRIGQGGGRRPPFPLSLSLFPPPVHPIPTWFGGNPTPGGRRAPRPAPSRQAAPSPLSLYIRGQGGTSRHTS